MKKKIYVSLPITGHQLDDVKRKASNIKRAIEEESKINCIEVEVITPFDACPDSCTPYNVAMGKDIEALLGCDAICLCSGWGNSKGCRAEYEVAKVYGKEVFFEREFAHVYADDVPDDYKTINIIDNDKYL